MNFATKIKQPKVKVEIRITCSHIDFPFNENLQIGAIEGYDHSLEEKLEKEVIKETDGDGKWLCKVFKYTFRYVSNTSSHQFLLSTESVGAKTQDIKLS